MIRKGKEIYSQSRSDEEVSVRHPSTYYHHVTSDFFAVLDGRTFLLISWARKASFSSSIRSLRIMDTFALANNSLAGLPTVIRDYVQEKIQLCQPTNFHVCNGSDEENQQLLDMMEQMGMIRRLRKYKNW